MPNNVIFITFAVISVLEAIVIIIGNAVAIFVFWSQRLSLRRACFLLINLAIADLLVGITEPIVLAIEKIPNSESVRAQEKPIENLSSAFQLLGTSTSVFFLALISVERVFAVSWPLRHRVLHTRAYIYSIIIVWALGLCVAALLLLAVHYVNHSKLFFAITSWLLVISLLVICTSYLAIRSRLQYTPPGLGLHNRQSTEHNLRISRTFFIVIALSLVFWLPGFVVYNIRVFFPSYIFQTGVWIVNCLRLANSMVNPFVYSFRMPIFQDALKRCWRKRRPQIIALRPVQACGRVLGRRGSFTPQMDHTVSTSACV